MEKFSMRAVAAALAMTTAAMALPAAADTRPAATIEDYRRAERFLPWNLESLVLNREIQHGWIAGSERLWYKRATEGGHEFVIADAARGVKAPAFDHEKMAKALGQALDKTLDPKRLPVEQLIFTGSAAVPVVVAEGRNWTCDLGTLRCKGEARTDAPPGALLSPDGRGIVFVRDHNLWHMDVATGKERALTTDGDADRPYGVASESSTSFVSEQRMGAPSHTQGLFSPDGRKFLTYRLDQSEVKPLHLLQHVPEDGSFRPKLFTYRYPFAGDREPTATLLIFDLATGKATPVDHPPVAAPYMGPVALQRLHWAPGGAKAYFLRSGDSHRELSLVEIDGETGATRVLISERSDIYFLPSNVLMDLPVPRLLSSGDFIWASERSGYYHLYLHDGRTGKLKNAITKGDWMVRELIRVDEAAGRLYFTAVGREKGMDPYFRVLYRVNLDGTGLTRLTPEDADHEIRPVLPPTIPTADGPDPAMRAQRAGFSPSGAHFVDSYSRPDQPTVHVVRDADGKLVMELERASLAKEIAGSYIPPEPFRALAADGKTEIHGLIYKPANFDPARRYPVVDSIYPGPQILRVPKRFMDDMFGAQALAELGFIVVTVDGRGTPLRSRDFRAVSYRNMGAAGNLEDHVAAIRDAARTRPYMDLDKVGIYGTSGGGFATARAMFDYPDFFKVGVSSAGNHDQRTYISLWGETYHGPWDADDYASARSYLNVRNFRGKLLIAHGDMDDNVHPANTMRVVDELIRHDKDFDMLIMPNVNHGISGHPYFVKKLWNYFVTHLQGATPPEGFAFGMPGGTPPEPGMEQGIEPKTEKAS